MPSKPPSSSPQAMEQPAKRSLPRHDQEISAILINGTLYPVMNWSLSGVLFAADSRLFAVDAPISFTLKFKTGNTIIEVEHHGTIARKNADGVALRYAPLSTEQQSIFQSVLKQDKRTISHANDEDLF